MIKISCYCRSIQLTDIHVPPSGGSLATLGSLLTIPPKSSSHPLSPQNPRDRGAKPAWEPRSSLQTAVCSKLSTAGTVPPLFWGSSLPLTLGAQGGGCRDPPATPGVTYHKHQLKLVVQFVLKREGFMGEGVVATSLLGERSCQNGGASSTHHPPIPATPFPKVLQDPLHDPTRPGWVIPSIPGLAVPCPRQGPSQISLHPQGPVHTPKLETPHRSPPPELPVPVCPPQR